MRNRRRQGPRGALVAVGVALVAGFAIYRTATRASAVTEPSIESPAPVVPPPKPRAVQPTSPTPNEAQFATFKRTAERVAEAINDDDSEALAALTDQNAFVDRIADGLMPHDMREGAEWTELKRSIPLAPTDAFTELLPCVVQFVRLIKHRGHDGALLRARTPKGAIGYAFLVPSPTSGGRLVADVLAPNMIAFASEIHRGAFKHMLSMSAEEARTPQRLQQSFLKAAASHDAKTIDAALRALPAVLRDSPAMRTAYLHALSRCDDDRAFAAALDQTLSEDPSSLFALSMKTSLLAKRKDWQGALETARRLDTLIGGDAYLHAVSALYLARLGRHEEARAACESAEAADAALLETAYCRLVAECARKDWKAAAATLLRLRKDFEFDADAEDLPDLEPEFRSFTESAEFKALPPK